MTDDAARERELIAAARNGSSAAFAALVRAHQHRVRGFLWRASGNQADADDLAQETFLSAWLQLRNYRQEARFATWLCAIAYRKLLMRRRAGARSRLREEAAGEEMSGAAPGGSDLRLDVQRAVEGLSVEQRSVAALCLASDFSQSEAAAALGIPLGTVKSHVARCRERLREFLGEYNDAN